MINLALLAPPGGGKSTQGKLLIAYYDLVHVAPGDLLRAQIQQNTPLGKQVQAYIDKGELAPAQLVIDMIHQKIAAHPHAKGFLLDGYPRTSAQLASLHAQLDLDLAILLEVGEPTIKKRLATRCRLQHRADDQDEGTIARRVQLYTQHTLPIAEHYQNLQKLVRIPAEGSIQQVTDCIQAAIQLYLSQKMESR